MKHLTILARLFVLLAATTTLFTACMTFHDTVSNVQTVPGPAPGKALVVFYREGQFAGSAVGFGIGENGNLIGRVYSGTYFRYEVDPGIHCFTASWETTESKTFPLEGGKTYFVRCGIHDGFVPNPSQTLGLVGALASEPFMGRPHMQLIIPSEGSAAIKKLRLAGA